MSTATSTTRHRPRLRGGIGPQLSEAQARGATEGLVSATASTTPHNRPDALRGATIHRERCKPHHAHPRAIAGHSSPLPRLPPPPAPGKEGICSPKDHVRSVRGWGVSVRKKISN
jgi:hypothetical protein